MERKVSPKIRTWHGNSSDQFEISEGQKAALAPFIGEVKYDVPFKIETLESELANRESVDGFPA